MSALDVVSDFWAAMQTNDWQRAAEHLAPNCAIDWPCTGERIVGRDDFAAVQAQYPTRTGRWSFDVHRLVDGGSTVVSEVTVTDGEQSARVVAFSDVVDDHVIRHVEYWPIAYEALPGRENLTRPIPRVP
jgi:limonene-1,2-epoxide hydrolase